MYFHHLHFYVQKTAVWQKWFGQKLSFNSLLAGPRSGSRSTEPGSRRAYEVLKQGNIEIRLSAPRQTSRSIPSGSSASACKIETYLQQHPSGLVDIAFATDRFDAVLQRAIAQGAALLAPATVDVAGQRQCQLGGWAHLRHTLIEVNDEWIAARNRAPALGTKLCDIDHVVINVPRGELQAAATWYQRVFGMALGQQFDIRTARSGLHSQVLVHPDGPLQLPINEPSSPNSQIQEFLRHNRGAGVQHVALRSQDAVGAIAHFRQQGLDLLEVPSTYYDSLHQRSDCPLKDFSAISAQQLLIDWPQGGQQGMLLQTFTQPIFDEPTFFFEIIERRSYVENGRLKAAQGFGEGNFQALFEAIERSQMKREE